MMRLDEDAKFEGGNSRLLRFVAVNTGLRASVDLVGPPDWVQEFGDAMVARALPPEETAKERIAADPLAEPAEPFPSESGLVFTVYDESGLVRSTGFKSQVAAVLAYATGAAPGWTVADQHGEVHHGW